MLKFAICEDDTFDSIALTKAISELRGWDIYYDVFTSGEDLLESDYYKKREYDLYILDVEMRGIDGISLANEIRKSDDSALFIFATNHSKYQVDALNLISMGYISKPVTVQNLEAVLSKARPFIQKRETRVTLISNKIKHIVRANEILYVYAIGRKKYVVTNDNQIETNTSIDELMKLLPEDCFAQPHKSYIVNLHKIDTVSKDYLLLVGGEKIEISKNRRKDFNDKLMLFLGRIA